jgi:hypothetical protein
VAGFCEHGDESRGSVTVGNFLASWRTVSFSRRALLDRLTYTYTETHNDLAAGQPFMQHRKEHVRRLRLLYSTYQKFPDSEFNNDVTSPGRMTLRRGRTD